MDFWCSCSVQVFNCLIVQVSKSSAQVSMPRCPIAQCPSVHMSKCPPIVRVSRVQVSMWGEWWCEELSSGSTSGIISRKWWFLLSGFLTPLWSKVSQPQVHQMKNFRYDLQSFLTSSRMVSTAFLNFNRRLWDTATILQKSWECTEMMFPELTQDHSGNVQESLETR